MRGPAGETKVISGEPFETGRRLFIVFDNGTEREVELKNLSVQYSVSDEEYKLLSPEELGQKIDEAAIEMGCKQLGLAYDEFNRTVTNVVDAGGKPLSSEHILQAFEAIQIDFDAQGRPKLPTIVTHPDQFERYKQAMEGIESSYDLRERLIKIIAAKKEDWRDREGNRKLVG